MAAGQWETAYNEFYEGFRNYQEAGNKRAKDCLKYVVLANMLALSDINPFAAREAKVYQEEKEVAAMMELRMAYESNDLIWFERTLKNRANKILDDKFIMAYVDPLRLGIREQVLVAMVRPYSRITIPFISKELNLAEDDVEKLLVKLILEERLKAKIDRMGNVLEMEKEQSASGRNYEAIVGWAESLNEAALALTARI